MPSSPHSPASSARRAISPALGFAVVLVLVVIVAITVGMFVADVSEEMEPDATFEWTTTGEGASLAVTIEHADGDDIFGDTLRLDATGYDSLNDSATFADWGTVSNGSAYTVAAVDDAVVVNGTVAATADEWNASEAGYLDDLNASVLDPYGPYASNESPSRENVTVDGEEWRVADLRERLRERLSEKGVYVGDGVVALGPDGYTLSDGGTVLVHEPEENVTVGDLQRLTLVWDPMIVSAELDEYRIGS